MVLIHFLAGVIAYILQSVALYTIAYRRGFLRPWLAWIPVGNVWLLGALSDQYRYKVHGKVRNKRKVLLVLGLILAAFLVTAIWCTITMDPGPREEPKLNAEAGSVPKEDTNGLLAVLLYIGVLTLPIWAMIVAYTIFFYMALYDVFRSCHPKNSVLYLVLSLVGNVYINGGYSIFLMLCRDCDWGILMGKQVVQTIREEKKQSDI